MNKILFISVITVVMIVSVYFIPYYSLSVDRLKETYYVGESITFTGKQTGCNLSCDYHEISIFDENKTTVWSSTIVSDGQPPWIIPRMFWNNENMVGTSEDGPIVDSPGEYTVRYETKTSSVEKKFTVMPPLTDGPKNSIISEGIPLTLYVSNQSFIHYTIDITVVLDDKTVVSDTFDVEGQHSFHPFYLELGKGRHIIHVESDNGVSLTREFEIDKETWIVVSYWYYEEDEPFFNFDIHDKPVGFL